MRKVTLFLLACLSTANMLAQNPFEAYGYKVTVGTMTNGRFPEFHDLHDTVQIGSVLYDVPTGKVITFLETDTSVCDLPAHVSSRFITPDPHAERYYNVSPYAYCMNNPVKFVDPDGRDVKIWYQENGASRSFTYNGTQSNIPDNAFVKAVMTAYGYNVGNGGGDALKTAVTSSDVLINIMESDVGSQHAYGTVYWTPLEGLETNSGNVLSPATVLEHEMDHGVSYATNQKEHYDRADIKDKQYGNAEERRVITGNEQKTAEANKEVRKGTPTRTDHLGNKVIVESPTSTDIDRKKTEKFLEHIDDQRRKSW